jgi:hypothetical protein
MLLLLDWSPMFSGAIMPFAAALVSVGVSRDTGVAIGTLSNILFVSCEELASAPPDALEEEVGTLVTGENVEPMISDIERRFRDRMDDDGEL